MSYAAPPVAVASPVIITPWSLEAIGTELGAFGLGGGASAAPTSNLVTYVPFRLSRAFIVVEVSWQNGLAAGNGNAQVGIYDAAGTQIVECTATTTAGTGATQTIDVTDTTIGPGRYYMAFRASSATDRFISSAVGTFGMLEACGVFQQASQSDLPASATFAVPTVSVMTVFSINGTTLL